MKRPMSPHEFSNHFHQTVASCVLHLLKQAKHHGFEEGSTHAFVALASLHLSAEFHAGTRDEFMQLARDAYAVARTGELEQ